MSGASYSKSIEDQLKQLRNTTISSDIFSLDEPGGLVPMRRTKPKQSEWVKSCSDYSDSSGITEQIVDVREAILESDVREAKPESIFPEELIDLVQEHRTVDMQNPFDDNDSNAAQISEQDEAPTPEQIRRQRLNDKFSKGIVLVVLTTVTAGLVGAGFGIGRALLKRNHTRTMIL